MASTKKPQARLFAILARKAPVAVVFRRGPSRQVQLIKWNTADDTFEYGQWLKGRIYERRSDLSPNGELLIYFAANFNKPLYSWSAISRPPYLTALALWPKGDCWGGGGHFTGDDRIALNHRAPEMTFGDGFSVPKWLKLSPFGERPGWGEDDPVWSERLKRDGWTLTSWPTTTKDEWGAKVMWEPSPPIAWRKPHPKLPNKYSLEMAIVGIHERDGAQYMTEHTVLRDGDQDRIGRSDWADWSHDGDLLFSMSGCLYRVPCRGDELAALEDAKQVADFSGREFEALEAPAKFRTWPRRP